MSSSTPTCPSPTTIPLPNGSAMPAVGFGCWKLSSPASIVEAAVAAGWRHFDSACDYGNEEAVGEGLRLGMAKAGVGRDDMFITSKLWNTYHRPEHVEEACRRSLKDLGLDYLDLYLIHFPISLKHVPMSTRYPPEWTHDPDGDNVMVPDDGVTIAETWSAMEALVEKGLVKNIGVANFPAALLLELLKTAKVKPAVNQIELHPHLSQRRLVDFCKAKGIAVTGFSPLGSGSYVELSMDQGRGVGLLKDPAVLSIASKHGKTPAQVLLRWGVQRGNAVIPKTSSAARLAENLDVFGFELEEEDMEALYGLNLNARYNDPGVFCKGMGGDYPIWD